MLLGAYVGETADGERWWGRCSGSEGGMFQVLAGDDFVHGIRLHKWNGDLCRLPVTVIPLYSDRLLSAFVAKMMERMVRCRRPIPELTITNGSACVTASTIAAALSFP